MFTSWPDIGALYQVRKTVVALNLPTVIEYRGKIKLDGTNAAVRVEGGQVFAQSRSRDITYQDDNMGFAKWLFSTPNLAGTFLNSAKVDTIFYGEWCGEGIQKGTAISKAPKTFAIFAIQQQEAVIVEPDEIRRLLAPVLSLCPSVRVIDWHGGSFQIDFEKDLQKIASKLDAQVQKVEACDPWVKANFGVEGVGEGLVFFPGSPVSGEGVPRDHLANFIFKAKGEKHRVKEAKSPVQIDPDVFASIQEFSKTFVTPARCKQGLLVACGGSADMPNLGAFLKWVSADVEKESKDDLAASGLTFKQAAKEVQKVARTWFMKQKGKDT